MATPQQVIIDNPCLPGIEPQTLAAIMVGYLRLIAEAQGFPMTPQEILNANPCLVQMDEQTLRALTVGYLKTIQESGGGGGGSQEIFAGVGNPNGVVSSPGAAVYMDTSASPPNLWFKVAPGSVWN